MDEARARTAVIVVAAGSGERLGHGIPKAMVPLGGEPILAHALRGVLAADVAAEILVCVPPGDTELRRLCAAMSVETASAGSPVMSAVDGGTTRAGSVQSALAALGGDITTVLIHDAARPLTPAEVFHRVADALQAGALAVIPGIAVADTVKMTRPADPGTPAPELVDSTPDRDVLRAVQTPQGFSVRELKVAHAAAGDQLDRVTDDAMLMEAQGVDVFVVRGSERSRKITTEVDLQLAEALLAGPLAPRWVEG